jgi:UDP-glucose 4-epimerase
LLEQGHHVVVADNLINSKQESLRRVATITGKALDFHQVDLLDEVALNRLFETTDVEAVIHFAGLKAVGDSVKKPLEYYRNNVVGTLNLLDAMLGHGVTELIFSSSATVYGDPESSPITEDAAIHPSNPYGQTKAMIEQILRDTVAAYPKMRVALLRYFNPVGAHVSGMIGEDPQGTPNNLVPFVSQVASGKLEQLKIFGHDYDTPDGTCIRDYVHVMDLAEGHAKAMDYLESHEGVATFNLGTGQGKSVLEVVDAFEQACGQPIPREFVERRPGDVPAYFADVTKAAKELGWKAQRSMLEMCADAWRWQSKNPHGYD